MKFGIDVWNQSPDMTPEKNLRKGGVVRVTWPHFWALTVNISKIAKCSNVKFGMHAPRQSPDMTPEKNSQQTHWNFLKNDLCCCHNENL